MRNTLFMLAFRVLLMALLASASAFAFTTTIDTANGLEDDAYANGRIVDGSTSMANWTLSTTVSNTDFANDAITGGPSGLEYVMSNVTKDSRDSNSIRFELMPEVGYSVEHITISQSPYHNDNGDTWNGGNAEASQFVLSWAGGGVAMVSDPDNQIFAFSTGTPIVSGTTVRYADSQIYNSVDTWSIQMPAGVDAVQVNWSSANPSPNSDLTREWVAFDSSFAPVPEPSTMALLGLAGLLVVFQLRRFKS